MTSITFNQRHGRFEKNFSRFLFVAFNQRFPDADKYCFILLNEPFCENKTNKIK